MLIDSFGKVILPYAVNQCGDGQKYINTSLPSITYLGPHFERRVVNLKQQHTDVGPPHNDDKNRDSRNLQAFFPRKSTILLILNTDFGHTDVID